MADIPALTEDTRRQLAFTRWLRRAAFFCLLAPVLVTLVLIGLNRLTGGAMHIFVSGARWTQVFWDALFDALVLGIVLSPLTVARRCPRCGEGFFVTRGYRRTATGTRTGGVNVFAGRCINCQLPLA